MQVPGQETARETVWLGLATQTNEDPANRGVLLSSSRCATATTAAAAAAAASLRRARPCLLYKGHALHLKSKVRRAPESRSMAVCRHRFGQLFIAIYVQFTAAPLRSSVAPAFIITPSRAPRPPAPYDVSLLPLSPFLPVALFSFLLPQFDLLRVLCKSFCSQSNLFHYTSSSFCFLFRWPSHAYITLRALYHN